MKIQIRENAILDISIFVRLMWKQGKQKWVYLRYSHYLQSHLQTRNPSEVSLRRLLPCSLAHAPHMAAYRAERHWLLPAAIQLENRRKTRNEQIFTQLTLVWELTNDQLEKRANKTTAVSWEERKEKRSEGLHDQPQTLPEGNAWFTVSQWILLSLEVNIWEFHSQALSWQMPKYWRPTVLKHTQQVFLYMFLILVPGANTAEARRDYVSALNHLCSVF